MSRLSPFSAALLLWSSAALVGCPAPPEDAEWVLRDGNAPPPPAAPGQPQGPPLPSGQANAGPEDGVAVTDAPIGGVAPGLPAVEGAPDGSANPTAGGPPQPMAEGEPPAPAEPTIPPSVVAGEPPGSAGGVPGALPPDEAVGPAPAGVGVPPPIKDGKPNGEGGTPPKPLPPEGSGQKARPDVKFSDSGSMVTVSGTITPATAKEGTLRIDVLKPGMAGFPELIHSEELKKGGPFSLRIPKNTGEIRIIAYFDLGEPGPQEGEDAGRAQLTILSEDHSNVQLKIAKIDKKDD